MKSILATFLLFYAHICYGQSNVYTFNDGKIYSEKEVKLGFDRLMTSLSKNRILKPVIYNKIIKKNTIVNYIEFSSTPRKSDLEKSEFKFSFKQDATFLLLDKKMPDFELKDLDGKRVSLKQLIGKPTLINFWAIYCGPCIAEMPALSKLKEKYGSKMNFVSITENNGVDDNLKEFLKNKSFNFMVLENGLAYKELLRLSALPRNLFIDRNGILRYIKVNFPINNAGKNTEEESNSFTKIIEELIQ